MLELLEELRPHHKELRARLIRCLLVLFLTSSLAYLGKDQLTAWCMRPLYLAYPDLGKLVYTRLPEALFSYLKLSLLTGFLVSLPFLLHQAWMFAAPGLLPREKRMIRAIAFWAGALLAAGVLFAFFIVLPRLLHYFMSYASPTLTPKLQLGLYLGFVGRLVLAFALAFEIPFLMVMALRSGLMARDHFTRKRAWFYLAIGVLALFLTGGELVAALLLSLPLFALYEAGILAARVFPGKPAAASTGMPDA